MIQKFTLIRDDDKRPIHSVEDHESTWKIPMEDTIEKRGSDRVKTRRDVIIAKENSDLFFNAELIGYSWFGICFLSKCPFQAGTLIYVITDNHPIDDFNDEITEAYFVNVICCNKSDNRYRIEAAVVETGILDIPFLNKTYELFETDTHG